MLFALALTGFASSEPIMIDITTTNSGVSYTVNNRPRIAGDPKTPEEIETWLREVVKISGDHEIPILVYPDDQTSFKTVLNLLRRFKAAGIKQFLVITKEPGDGFANGYFLRVTADKVGSY